VSYRIPLPEGGRQARLDIVEPNSTATQRFIRRCGLGAYEPPTAAAVLALCERAQPGFVVFDVGANMGLYGFVAASMFAPGHVDLFEPTPHAAAAARRIAARNRLPATVHEVAVSDAPGSAELFLSPGSDASNSLVEGFRETEQSIVVPTVTLDDVVARTGRIPDIVKLDVETHERAVLEGARGVIESARPSFVIEVLKRRGRDHGREISEFFAGLDYSCYELSATPSWQRSETVHGSGTTDRDWLLVPSPLDERFPQRWTVWHDRWIACTAERNPRVPLLPTTRAAFERGGVREIYATAQRYRRSRRAT